MGKLYFVTGGARSGKSRFAQGLAEAEAGPVVYLATMEPLDDELVRRVARHRAERPVSWQTVEAPLALERAIVAAPEDAMILLDCLSLWVTNRLLPLGDEPEAAAVDALEAALDAELDACIAAQGARLGALIVVTNEVGSGVVPPSALGRVYRDLLGRANQRVSLRADRAWLIVAGRALELPPPRTD
jgi:adenosyl cobinamide kinase/adenosyl cobinamide phosphate guanylyltransferase